MASHWDSAGRLRVELRPHTAGADLLELRVTDDAGEKLANVIFASIRSARPEHPVDPRPEHGAVDPPEKRLMTLVQLFLIHRYRAGSLHYLTPTDDNQAQAQRDAGLGIFAVVRTEIGQIIVADVDREQSWALRSARRGKARRADSEAGAPGGMTQAEGGR